MNPKLSAAAILTTLIGLTTPTLTQPSPTTAPTTDPSTGLDRLRAALTSAYSHGDIDGMLKYLHPDAVIIFPDGRILKGPQGLRDYYDRMLKAPDHIVASYTAEPVVLSRTVHGDVGFSYGMMNDKYVLTNGKSFGLDSRFTATLYRTRQGPSDSDGWMIRSFHSSTDAFDNPVLGMAARIAFWRAIWIGGAVGIVAGLVVGLLIARRRQRGGPSSSAATNR
jgi:ketosteroid isomerase-like protein